MLVLNGSTSSNCFAPNIPETFAAARKGVGGVKASLAQAFSPLSQHPMAMSQSGG
ncbi:hypothetical protein Agau_C201085 [Agrobacterium tumefaciens F2]|nr:hypothetical protein Agau_C201085 [Agrobacterium tumefaciens F2]